jgi:hypothetical protein
MSEPNFQELWTAVCEQVTGPRLMSNPDKYNRLTHPERVGLACWFTDLRIKDPSIKSEALVGRPSAHAVQWAGRYAVAAEELAAAYRALSDLWGDDPGGIAGAQ